MLSYWEKESFVDYDFVIIGSGIVGLSTAISLKEHEPNASVLVLERGIFPTGASTKNAGFACFGSLTELLEDLKSVGEEGTLQLVNQRWQGLQMLRKRIGDHNFDYYNHGGYELIREEELKFLADLDKVNTVLHPIFNAPVFKLEEDKISKFRFNKREIKSIIYNQFEGQIHTGKMMRSLLDIAKKHDIEVLTGAEVEDLEDTGSAVKVKVKSASAGQSVTFKAKKVAVCTNGFTKKLIPELDLAPGRGIVLVTKPITNLPFEGVFHIEKGYYYFRNEGSRVIFGGGRNLDYSTEKTEVLAINEHILSELKRQLSEIILPDTPYEVDQTWAGIMAFGENKVPILKKHSKSIHLGVRLGGMGVAIGSQMGDNLSKAILTE